MEALVVSSIDFNRLRSETLSLHTLDLDIASFNEHTEDFRTAFVDAGQQGFRVSGCSNSVGHIVDLRTGLGCQSTEVGRQFNPLETVQVVFDQDGLNVQFLCEQFVEC